MNDFQAMLEQDKRDPATEKRTEVAKCVPPRDRGSQGPTTPFGKILSEALKEAEKTN